jgi:hypothetical protein
VAQSSQNELNFAAPTVARQREAAILLIATLIAIYTLSPFLRNSVGVIASKG